MLSGHSAAQEIKHMWKINQSFYWISNPQFWEKSQPIHGLKAVMFRLTNFLF